jgi:hypothetical protein
MTTEQAPQRDDVAGPVRICAACGHQEDEHEEQEAEVAGDTLRRTVCLECADWHDFVPRPD